MENNSTILTNDPYLNTARLTIRDKRYKNLYTKRMEKRSFLKQKIDINNYIFLSKEISTIIFILSFIFIPYILGIMSVFMFIAHFKIYVFEKLNYSFSLFWAIGYEILASILLFLIIKSAFGFGKEE
jgi:hypothetical protein